MRDKKRNPISQSLKTEAEGGFEADKDGFIMKIDIW